MICNNFKEIIFIKINEAILKITSGFPLSTLDLLVSKPEITQTSKLFDTSTGHYILRIESIATYNSVFQLDSFSLRALNMDFYQNFSRNISSQLSTYQNIPNIHDRIAKCISEIIITPIWSNISMIALVKATSFNSSIITISATIVVDYRAMFQGNS